MLCHLLLVLGLCLELAVGGFRWIACLGIMGIVMNLSGVHYYLRDYLRDYLRGVFGVEDSRFHQEEFREKTTEYVKKAASSGVGKVFSETVTVAQKKIQRELLWRKLKEYGKERYYLGGICTIFSGISVLSMVVDGDYDSWVKKSIFLLFFGYQSLLGWRRRKIGGRMLCYLNVIDNQTQFPVGRLCELTGEREAVICRDFEYVIEKGILRDSFLDRRNLVLVFGDKEAYLAQGFQSGFSGAEGDYVSETEQEMEHEILAEIRLVKEEIGHQKISAQVDHIAMITGKILEYQVMKGEKVREIHKFLSYYLPTTLKILKTYVQLEQQQIEGANISAGKLKIENAMEKIVEGFEKQLDQLFQEETLDVSSDIVVLEQMMAKDGLTGEMLELRDFME